MTIQVLLGLIYLGSSAAFNAFVGVAVICLGCSNAMPVAISLANGRRDVADSPFPLGRFGFALNVAAIVWVIFEVVLFCMPAVVPVTSITMSEWTRRRVNTSLSLTQAPTNRLRFGGVRLFCGGKRIVVFDQ
jgi:hypothetical protein